VPSPAMSAAIASRRRPSRDGLRIYSSFPNVHSTHVWLVLELGCFVRRIETAYVLGNTTPPRLEADLQRTSTNDDPSGFPGSLVAAFLVVIAAIAAVLATS